MKARFVNTLLDFLFPADVECPLCSAENKGDFVCGLCPECAASFKRCSLPVIGFDSIVVFTAFEYEGTARKTVLDIKEGNKPYLSKTVALFLSELCKEADLRFDIIAYVPTSPENKRRRGFDHMRLIAEQLADEKGVPVLKGLKRFPRSRDQTDVPFERRYENVAGSFGYDGADLSGKSVLLIDDVTTSGATLTACSEALAKASPDNVVCMAFTRAKSANRII